MISRSVIREITRLGANAPSNSLVNAFPAGPPEAPAVPALAGVFAVLKRRLLFVAREDNFHAPVLRATLSSGIRGNRIVVAECVNAEAAVGEVRRSSSLEPGFHRRRAARRKLEVGGAVTHAVGISVDRHKQGPG